MACLVQKSNWLPWQCFLAFLIVLILICIFLNLTRDCKITQSDWPKLLALEIPEYSTYSSWTLLLTQWTDTSTCRNPKFLRALGTGWMTATCWLISFLARIIPDSSLWWSCFFWDRHCWRLLPWGTPFRDGEKPYFTSSIGKIAFHPSRMH